MKHFAAVIIIYSSLKCRRSTLCDAKSLESDVEAGASSGMLIQVCFCETPNGRKHDLLSQSSWQKFRSRFRDTPSSFPNKTLVAVPFGNTPPPFFPPSQMHKPQSASIFVICRWVPFAFLHYHCHGCSDPKIQRWINCNPNMETWEIKDQSLRIFSLLTPCI